MPPTMQKSFQQSSTPLDPSSRVIQARMNLLMFSRLVLYRVTLVLRTSRKPMPTTKISLTLLAFGQLLQPSSRGRRTLSTIPSLNAVASRRTPFAAECAPLSTICWNLDVLRMITSKKRMLDALLPKWCSCVQFLTLLDSPHSLVLAVLFCKVWMN